MPSQLNALQDPVTIGFSEVPFWLRKVVVQRQKVCRIRFIKTSPVGELVCWHTPADAIM